MVNILQYIDDMQVMYGDKEPRSVDPEPRNNFNVGGGADVSPQTGIDDAFWINHYNQVIDARLGAMEAVKKQGEPVNPVDAKYLYESYNELKKYGGDAGNFDQRIRNLSPSAKEPEFAAHGGRIGQLVRNTVDGSRPGYSGSAFTRALMLLKNFNKTGAVKGLEEKLIKKYKSEGMEFIEALKKAQTEAGGVRYEGRMKIIKEAMDNTNIHSDDYVDLLDMKIKIEDPNFAKQYVNFSENLKNKTRSRHDSNWAEANFGEEYGTKLDQARVREINKSIDPNITERSLVDDIDDMNTANIDEFFGRKKNADGGVQQLVSNTVDGSRPGYNGNPGALKVFNKALDSFYNEFDKEVVDAASIQDHGVTFDKLKGEDKRRSFKKYFKQDMKDYGEYIGTENPNKDRRTMKRGIRATREADIKIKLIDATKKGDFFKPEKFAEDNKITLKQLKAEAKQLQRNIYEKRMITAGKESRATLVWLSNSDFEMDNVLEKISKSGLVNRKDNRTNTIFFDAFGREFKKGTIDTPNPTYNFEKYKAIRKNVNEFGAIKKLISKKYPNLNFDLDHGLSQQTINKLFNGTPEELSRVNIMDADLNRGFKKSLSEKYFKALGYNENGKQIGKVNLEAKKAVEKIAKDLNINIGNVSDDLKTFDRGVQSFEKLNIREELINSLKKQSSLNKNFKTFVNENPKLLTTAGFKDVTKINEPKTQVSTQQIDEIDNFLAKRQKVMDVGKANAAFKTMKQGGQKVSDEVILICKTNLKSMGGRIGYKLGSGGCPFAEANPKGFLEAVKNNKVLKSFLKTPQALNIARTVARASDMTLNPLSWIGGEAWYIGLDAMNRASKGIPGDEALDDAFFFYDFKKVDENILKTAEKMGLDKNQIQLIKSNMAINRNMSELGKRQKLLERAGSDIADISEIDTGVVNQEIDKINSDLKSNIYMYITKTSQITGKNRNELADSDFGIGLNLTNKTFSQKVLAERQSEFKNIRTRADELAGGMGNWLNTNIFNTDVWTQPLKYAADVIDPRTKGVSFKTKEQQEQAYLNKIGKEYLTEPSTVISDVGTEEYSAGKKNPNYNPRELYLYNKSRNLTRDNPNMKEALSLRRSYQPSLGTGMFNLSDEGGYNLFGQKDGGRIGYMGGGITAIRRLNAIPPKRQGLRSILINGKKS